MNAAGATLDSARRPPRHLATGGTFASLLAMAAIGVGCGGSSYTPPTPFHATHDNIVKLIIGELGNGPSPGTTGSPSISCRRGSCDIRYTIKEAGGLSFDLELVQPTFGIYRAMFDDPTVQHVVLHARGPATTGGGKSDTATYFVAGCTRSEADNIDWANVQPKGFKQICNYRKMIR